MEVVPLGCQYFPKICPLESVRITRKKTPQIANQKYTLLLKDDDYIAETSGKGNIIPGRRSS